MRTSSESHAVALMMCNQSESKGSTGSTVTGITKLSHDLMFQKGGSWGTHGRCASSVSGACCKIMVLIFDKNKVKELKGRGIL